jgi:hypothetical protein
MDLETGERYLEKGEGVAYRIDNIYIEDSIPMVDVGVYSFEEEIEVDSFTVHVTQAVQIFTNKNLNQIT